MHLTTKILLVLLISTWFLVDVNILGLILIFTLITLNEIFQNSQVEKQHRYPPGPIKLPFLGCLPMIIYKGSEEYLMEMYRKYGDIVSLQLGNVRNIVINDYETIKEFGVHPDFQSRPKSGIINDIMEGHGLLDSQGPKWKHQRIFVMQALRECGMGNLEMHDKIGQELQNLVTEIASYEEQPVNLNILLRVSTCNIIFNLACNKKFDYKDPEFNIKLEKLDQNIKLGGKLFFAILFPWLRIFLEKDIATVRSNVQAFLDMGRKFIDEHKKSLDVENPKDLIDLYLIEMNKEVNDENFEYQSTFSERQLRTVISDLFAVGTETSSTTIMWGILYMIHYPDIQKKIQKEINSVIGMERAPKLSDKINLPYTVATLQEIERLASVVPKALPRSNERSMQFKGYTFPAGTFININIHAVHRDPKLWNDPDAFMPERFIDSNGKVHRPPYLLAYGSGKRSCAGEALARMEVFLYFVKLLQKFSFEKEGENLPELRSVSGLVRNPRFFRVRAKQITVP